MKNFLKNKNGFSIIEIIFGISIFALIILSATLLARNVFFYNSFISSSLDDADAGRKLMKTIAAEIRTASFAETGAYIINAASSSSLTFYGDIDNDGLKERVRYFKNGTLLQKGVIEPSGTPLGYSGAETIKTVLPYVTNTTIFEYYDKDYAGTESPLSSPINIPLIRLIKIIVTTDKDTSRPPDATTFSTQVSIRNLKDNWNE